MRTRLAPAVLAALLLTAGLAGATVGATGSSSAGGGTHPSGPVPGTHSVNYVSMDSQATADGTVVVESVFIERSGWVVLHAPAEGDERLGEALGAARVRTVNRFRGDVAVPLDESVWRNWSTGEVVVTLHGEDGDGEFTDADPPLAGFGTIVRDEATVARGDRALVTAEGDFPQRVDGPAVELRRVSLPADGRVVLRNRTADGRVVGTRSLDAGDHRNVTVAVNESFYESRPGTFTLRAELRAGDGEPFRAGNDTVATAFRVRPASGGGAVVTTPATASATPTGGPTATAGPTDTAGTTTDGQSGFGAAAVVAALLVALAAAARDS